LVAEGVCEGWRGSMRFQGLPRLSSTVFLALSGSCSGGRMAVDLRIALGLREGHAHARTARVFSSICNLNFFILFFILLGYWYW
jgi:hypothetical protein